MVLSRSDDGEAGARRLRAGPHLALSLLLALVIPALPAAADPPVRDVIASAIRKTAHDVTDPKSSAANLIFGDAADEGNVKFALKADKQVDLYVVGACDAHCSVLQLYGLDAKDQVSEASDTDTETPVLTIPAGSDIVALEVDVAQCDQPKCTFGFGVFRKR